MEFCFCLLTPLILFSIHPAAAQMRVCESCELTTIEQAVHKAEPGTTITLARGTYHEHDILIEKTLAIVGEDDQVVVDGGGVGNVFLIRAPHTKLSHLTIRHSGIDFTDDLAGIKVMDTHDCLLEHNLLEQNAYGIYLGNSQDCRVSQNRIHGTRLSETSSGDGIHIWHGARMQIDHNEMSGNRDGIYLEFVKDSHIRGNHSEDNLRYGLHFMFSNSNQFEENVFDHNLSGVAVMYSKHITIRRNLFAYSLGPAAYGILLKDISDSQINENQFRHNTFGAYLEGTTRTHFEQNDFVNNGWALRVLGDTDTNEFTRNDFIRNTFDVSTNATSNQNVFKQNHWSHYKGLDLNHDGIGDDPYHVVQFSSMLMEHFSASVLLVHSFFFYLLDQIEAALPAFIPATFQDPQPLMKRVSLHD